ncbi:hypothetical protein [Helicobacter sp. 23-1046]
MKFFSHNIQTTLQNKGLNPTSSAQIARFVWSFELGFYISIVLLIIAGILHIDSHYFFGVLVGLCGNTEHTICGTAYNVLLTILVCGLFSRHTFLLVLTGITSGICGLLVAIVVLEGIAPLLIITIIAMLFIAPFVLHFFAKKQRTENFFTLLSIEIYAIIAFLLPILFLSAIFHGK